MAQEDQRKTQLNKLYKMFNTLSRKDIDEAVDSCESTIELLRILNQLKQLNDDKVDSAESINNDTPSNKQIVDNAHVVNISKSSVANCINGDNLGNIKGAIYSKQRKINHSKSPVPIIQQQFYQNTGPCSLIICLLVTAFFMSAMLSAEKAQNVYCAMFNPVDAIKNVMQTIIAATNENANAMWKLSKKLQKMGAKKDYFEKIQNEAGAALQDGLSYLTKPAHTWNQLNIVGIAYILGFAQLKESIIKSEYDGQSLSAEPFQEFKTKIDKIINDFHSDEDGENNSIAIQFNHFMYFIFILSKTKPNK